MAIISTGLSLSYDETSGSSFKKLTNLQEVPDLGAETDAVEITTLEDEAHVYTDGLENYGDNLPFKFLYDDTQFTTLCGLTGSIHWKVELPGSAKSCTFTGSCRVKLDGVGVNAPLTYTLNIRPNSKMEWA